MVDKIVMALSKREWALVVGWLSNGNSEARALSDRIEGFVNKSWKHEGPLEVSYDEVRQQEIDDD